MRQCGDESVACNTAHGGLVRRHRVCLRGLTSDQSSLTALRLRRDAAAAAAAAVDASTS